MQKIKSQNYKFLSRLISSLFVFLLPIFICAAAPLVPCDGVTNECDLNDFIALINNIINWILSIATFIFAIMLIWGGFTYLTSGANQSKKEEAKKMLWSTLLGFVIILVSWLIVYTILDVFIDNNSDYRGSIFKYIGNGN